MTERRKTSKHRRGRPRPESVTRPDVPHTIKLADGRTLFVEVPGRHATVDRSGEVAFTPDGVRFLDRLRALASPLNQKPSPAYITAVREGLGMTQAELGARLGIDKMTVSRWERGTMRPSSESMEKLKTLVAVAKRKGVVLAG